MTETTEHVSRALTEAVAAAIDDAQNMPFSIQLTRLVEGESTYSCTFSVGSPVEFSSYGEASRYVGAVRSERLARTLRRIFAAPIEAERPPMQSGAAGWSADMSTAPEQFDETYFLVRPRGIHPGRGGAFVPTAVTRLGNELFLPENHIDAVQWAKNGDVQDGPTTNMLEADLEWCPLP